MKREFLHYLRIREWQDLHGQLRGTARRLGMTVGEPAAEPDERGIHAALLAGLLSHVGLQVEQAKTGTASRAARAASTSAPATPGS